MGIDVKFTRTNGELDRKIDDILEMVGTHHPRIVREMVLSALKAGHDTDYLADLKLMRTTMKEMRYTTKIFAPYRQQRKVTIFGSARTGSDQPAYRKCVEFSRLLADNGYMVITGGGGGIMQAGNEGAGAENSFAINIRLPFEQETNPVMENSRNVLTYNYFFNRKVAFLKEAHAIVLFPGGFGTMDEAMEAMTLMQTGKNPPVPFVLIDEDGGSYWNSWVQFVREQMLKKGLVSGEDFSLFTITESVQEAFEVVDSFYRVYHSSRYVEDYLVIRLNKELRDTEIAILASEFGEIFEPGYGIERCNPLPKEYDEPDLLELPRISFRFNRRSYGFLKAFIRRLNSFS